MEEKKRYSTPTFNIIFISDIVSTSGDDNILDWVPTAVSSPEIYDLDKI